MNLDGNIAGECDSSPTRDQQLKDFVIQAQHDLRNPLGNVLGFCEILLGQPNEENIKRSLRIVDLTASRMVTEIDRVLDPDRTPPRSEEVKALQGELRVQVFTMIATAQELIAKAEALENHPLCQDLLRMLDSAQRAGSLVETALSYPAA